MTKIKTEITVEVQATQTLRKKGRITIDVLNFTGSPAIDDITRFLYSYPHHLEQLDVHEKDTDIDEVRIITKCSLEEQAQEALQKDCDSGNALVRPGWIAGWIAGRNG